MSLMSLYFMQVSASFTLMQSSDANNRRPIFNFHVFMGINSIFDEAKNNLLDR